MPRGIGAIFSCFGRIGQTNFWWEADVSSFPLPKTIHTERHRKLRAILVAERKVAGLTQTVVAERLGKPPSYVAKYELGDRRIDILEFLDIAAAIGFDPCEVIRSLVTARRRLLRWRVGSWTSAGFHRRWSHAKPPQAGRVWWCSMP
jgi:Helix-turn-helix